MANKMKQYQRLFLEDNVKIKEMAKQTELNLLINFLKRNNVKLDIKKSTEKNIHGGYDTAIYGETEDGTEFTFQADHTGMIYYGSERNEFGRNRINTMKGWRSILNQIKNSV